MYNSKKKPRKKKEQRQAPEDSLLCVEADVGVRVWSIELVGIFEVRLIEEMLGHTADLLVGEWLVGEWLVEERPDM